MDWTLAPLILLVTLLLAGAAHTCWQGRETPRQTPPALCPLPWREGRPARLAYVDQLLAECLTRARRRLRTLEQLDERLRKPASSLACLAKR